MNSIVTILDNASFVELSCDMSNYIRPDDQLQWFRDGEMITSGQARRQITFMDGTESGQLGGLSIQSSRLSKLTISNPVSSDTGVYNCRVMGTTESVDLALIVQSLITNTTPEPTQPTTESVDIELLVEPETALTPILSVALGAAIGGLLLLILIIVVTSTVCVAKRKNLKHNQQKNHTDNQAYDYPDELPPRPLPQPETNDHEIQVTTDNDSPDHDYETTMDTANPAYGISASACIPIDTNIAYGMIEVTATNSAQQQGEKPPATNPDAIYDCPSVTHPTYKQEV